MTAVPAVMYHSVGRVLSDWAWTDLTVPARVFEDHLRVLRRGGWRTIDLYELDDHIRNRRPLRGRCVALTFDDGYLDNWTVVVPLLERYGARATVVVTPEFVDPRPVVRSPEPDAPGEDAVRGFMSWDELREASRRGVLSVQCHGMTHTWYPISDRVVDFHHPGDGRYWLDWNANPADKPFYLRDPGRSRVPWGVPVYEHAKSLQARRFVPDPREAQTLAEWVAAHGGAAFFERPDWRASLFDVLASWRRGRRGGGEYESDADRRRRYENELVESRRRIAEALGADVDFLVWPGGGYDDLAMSMAREIYRAVTISSAERHRRRNRPGDPAGEFVRRGVPELSTRRGRVFPGGRYLEAMLEEFRGSRLARRCRQAMKLGILARHGGGGRR